MTAAWDAAQRADRNNAARGSPDSATVANALTLGCAHCINILNDAETDVHDELSLQFSAISRSNLQQSVVQKCAAAAGLPRISWRAATTPLAHIIFECTDECSSSVKACTTSPTT